MAKTGSKNKHSERTEGGAPRPGEGDIDAVTAHANYKSQLHLLRMRPANTA